MNHDDEKDEIEANRSRRLRESLDKAPTTRRLAWELLKSSRNPLYVHLRYGIPVATLEEALKKIPEPEPVEPTRRARARKSEPGRPDDTTPPGSDSK